MTWIYNKGTYTSIKHLALKLGKKWFGQKEGQQALSEKKNKYPAFSRRGEERKRNLQQQKVQRELDDREGLPPKKRKK